LNVGEVGGFRAARNACTTGIQVITHTGRHRAFISQGLAVVLPFPVAAFALIFFIRATGQVLVEGLVSVAG